ncbi:MAG: hypothetical protein AAF226_16955 [Verrucomicrobiota bacterium]
MTVGEGLSRCGGGTMPKAQMPSITIDISPSGISLPKLAKLLRLRDIPMVGYIADDTYRFDLRTIMPEQDALLIENLRAVLNI